MLLSIYNFYNIDVSEDELLERYKKKDEMGLDINVI